MGEVYRAVDTRKDRAVALKVLGSASAGDPEFRRRFRREAESAARLHSPHVVPIHDYGEIDGRLYIDMRLVEGNDLAEVIRGTGPLGPTDAVGIIGHVADALDAAHRHRLVHRDVKPSNILLVDGRTDPDSVFAYLADFGIARHQEGTASSSAIIGSLDYMAPERFAGHPGDHTVDVYALAAVLHEALTGSRPFPGRQMASLMHAHIYGDVPVPSALRPGIPRALDAVVARGMAKEPRLRFGTAGALAADARAALAPPASTGWYAPVPVPDREQATFVPSPIGPPSPSHRSRRRTRGVAGGVGLVAAAAVVATAVALTPTSTPAPGGLTASPSSAGPTTTPVAAASSAGVTTIADIFGPACASLPTTGGGSPQGMTDSPVATAISQNPLLTTLATAIAGVPGLADTMNASVGLTVLAPVNGAFEAIPTDAFDAVLAAPQLLAAVLTGHISPTRYDAAALIAAGSVDMLNGDVVAVSGTADSPVFTSVGGSAATTLCGDIPTSNATLFIVDTVLLPA
jgi:serine/threonine-protein kinase